MTTDGTPSKEGNGVRITNAHIYDLLLETSLRVAAVEQSVRDVILPQLKEARKDIGALERDKVAREQHDKTSSRVERIEMRMYGIMAGLIMAFLTGKGMGFL